MEQIMIEVDPTGFASARESYILDRKGIIDYEWEVQNGSLVETIYVNQSSYKTYNYFKYRDSLESETDISIEDIDDGVVEAIYDCDLLVWGERCLNCGNISSSTVSTSNMTAYDTTTGKWVCANLL